jgi:hypothetical protein
MHVAQDVIKLEDPQRKEANKGHVHSPAELRGKTIISGRNITRTRGKLCCGYASEWVCKPSESLTAHRKFGAEQNLVIPDRDLLTLPPDVCVLGLSAKVPNQAQALVWIEGSVDLPPSYAVAANHIRTGHRAASEKFDARVLLCPNRHKRNQHGSQYD